MMDDIRGSPAGRRLSQIFDPIARFASDFGSSSSAPCSPLLGLTGRNYESLDIVESNGSRGGSNNTGQATSSFTGNAQESPRFFSRQQRSGSSTRQAPVPPPRNQQRNDLSTNTRSSTTNYINLPYDNFHHHGRRELAVSDTSGKNVKSDINYVELKDKENHYRSAKLPQFSFSAEPSGRVEYKSDKQDLYRARPEEFITSYGHFENDTSSEESSPAIETNSVHRVDCGTSLSSNVDKILASYAGKHPQQQQNFRRVSIDHDITFTPSTSAPITGSNNQRAYSSSKSFDTSYPTTVEELNWQERCLELQLELHRSRSQATRVRDMLRDKVSWCSCIYGLKGLYAIARPKEGKFF
ncbi:hypothetical protein PV327_005280 [Microctonus hyperodae]|uniref:Uncharacterized protein n=1 Tax=Microctonus hyperodae TaxID=165561 RepID=A0AA39G1T0_MICHY|nr:hypothetical protein PV327_005280 [Microctonus hyperodae]